LSGLSDCKQTGRDGAGDRLFTGLGAVLSGDCRVITDSVSTWIDD
jgi:hypothetical protein